MTWFKVDDQLPDHRKVRRLGQDRLAAVGLWTLCGAWASGKTDGFVPDEVVTRYDPDHFFAKRLNEVGLWHISEEDGETGYLYHDWLHYRSSREREEKVRADTRRRVQAFRGRQRAEQAQRAPDGTFVADGRVDPVDDYEGGNEDSNALPSNAGNATCNPAPDPTRTRTEEESPNVGGPVSSKVADATSDDAQVEERREDIESLCRAFADAREKNGSGRPKINDRWRTAARKMLDNDGREFEKTLRLIEWCQAHHHWHGRVRALPKFREEYGAIRKQAVHAWERERGKGSQTTPTTTARVQGAYSHLRPEEGDDDGDQLQLPGATA